MCSSDLNLGRPINSTGFPIDGSGKELRDPTGQPLPRAPRTRLCEEWTDERYGLADARRSTAT